MTLETWFWLAHAAAVAGWLPLLFMRGPAPVRIARAAAAVLAFGYAVLFILFARDAAMLARDYSLGGVAAFFAVRPLLLVGWIHYLAFDLFVGSWEAEEAERIGLSRGRLLPCLLLTFMAGPLGLLAFLALRAMRLRSRQ